MSHLEELGRFVAKLRHADVPENARRAARLQIANMIAAAHAAARGSEIAPAIEGARGFTIAPAVAGDASKGYATVIATGEKLAPCDAALVNAACSMAQDFDDIIWMGHTCHSAVFAPLAVCEHEGKTSEDLVTAVVVANEIAGRIGASSFLGPLNGQMWTFIHLAGAAASTAKLLGLSAEETTHALGIALAQPNFALQPGFMSPTSKLLAAATPTVTGIQAAYFARAKMTGHPRILEDRRGFWRRFSFLPLPLMLEGTGSFWAIETLTVKTFPGCHYFQTALTAIDRMRARGVDMSFDGIARVKIETTKLACEVTRFASDYVERGEISPVGVNFDLATSAAILFHAGRLTIEELEHAWLTENRSAIEKWRERITVVHDPELSGRVIASARRISTGRRAIKAIGLRDLVELAKRYRDEYRSRLFSAKDALSLIERAPRAFARKKKHGLVREESANGIGLEFPARVIIEMKSGVREEERVDLPVGSLAAEGVEREVEAKWMDASSNRLGEERARRGFAMVLAVESHELGDVVRSLV